MSERLGLRLDSDGRAITWTSRSDRESLLLAGAQLVVPQRLRAMRLPLLPGRGDRAHDEVLVPVEEPAEDKAWDCHRLS